MASIAAANPIRFILASGCGQNEKLPVLLSPKWPRKNIQIERGRSFETSIIHFEFDMMYNRVEPEPISNS